MGNIHKLKLFSLILIDILDGYSRLTVLHNYSVELKLTALNHRINKIPTFT